MVARLAVQGLAQHIIHHHGRAQNQRKQHAVSQIAHSGDQPRPHGHKDRADFPGGAGCRAEPHQVESARHCHAGPHIAVDHHNDHTDHRRQAQRLTGLTNDLIYLSRMEEEQPHLQPIDFPLSDVVEEMAQSFAGPAKSQGKDFVSDIQPMLAFTGDEKAMRQLVSILLDNALKYSPPDGHISLSLEKQGRSLLLTVTNTTAEPVQREQLAHLFDRFYRTDASRNSQTGGYGLGLSIARSIVSAHKGKIRAESSDGSVLAITVSLPVRPGADRT